MAQRENYFLPYLRRGLTTLADHDSVKGKRMTVPAKLTLTASNNEDNSSETATVEKEISLFGPGDLLGINNTVISRLVPPANTTNFESSLCPFMEFSEADFLWRFSSSSLRTKDKKNWIPWLTLVVLKKENAQGEGEFQKIQTSGKELPPQIRLKPNAVLPDLNESWRWAHVHTLDVKGSSVEAIAGRIKNAPEKVVCRLVCPRRLKPMTGYHAFLVPTFKIGAEAAMGITEGVTDRTVLTWKTPDEAAGSILPYYYDWEFSTGTQGDFELLVRKLKPRKLEDMGTRPIDSGNPGYGMGEAEGLELQLEAALRSLDTEYQAWGMDAPAGNVPSKNKRETLAALLNKREEQINGKVKLRVTPPVYGEWYASRQGAAVDPNVKKGWLEELNLDFRHRAAAGLGVQFVKENQENLMKAAWEQLSKIKKVNQELNLGRFGREVSLRMYKRLTQMKSTNVFKIALPVQNKIAVQPSKTIGSALRQSAVTNNLTQLKMKKYLSKARISKTVSDFKPIETTEVVTRGFRIKGLKNPLYKVNVKLFKPTVVAATKSVWPTGMVTATISSLDPKNTIESRLLNRMGRFKAFEKTEGPQSATEDQLAPVNWHPEFHRPMYRFLRDLSQDYILPGLDNVPQNSVGLLQTNRRFIEAFMLGLNHELASELRWREFPTDMRGSYFRSFWDTSIYSLDAAEKSQFRTTSIGKALLEKIKKKYGAAFNTFPKIENSYTKGDPNELEKEIADAYEQAVEKWLLTRDEDKDIERLAKWKSKNRLGDNPVNGNPNDKEEDLNRLVLLVRGELLLKFSNTLIYLVKSKNGKPNFAQNTVRTFPVFEGALPPDTIFIGFPIKEKDASEYHVIFEERMTDLRFGLDETPEGSTPGTGENDFSWSHFPTLPPEGYLDGLQPTIFKQNWNSAAYIGKVMMQKQVRAAIKLKTLLPD